MPFRSSFERTLRQRSKLTLLALSAFFAAGAWLLSAAALGQAGPGEGAQAGSIKVLMEELPPYTYTSPDGKPTGYAYELAHELLARAKLPASFEFMSWARVMLRSRSEAQVLVPAIVRLPEREAQFHWLGQIATRRGTLHKLRSRPDIKLAQLGAIGGYRIGVVKDDVSERELIALGVDAAQNLDRSVDHAGQLRRFFAGRSDLVALNPALAPALLAQQGFDPKLIEPVLKFSESRPSIALSLPTDEATRLRLQQAWDAMRSDGTLATIAARYPAIVVDKF